MEAFVCIHAHFYQPPRENAWLEAVEVQDSAFPYHDWNERITAECYATNATSRITDENGRIRDIVNNYARISFNFGPTLLSWLERNSADVYQAILAADTESRQRFSGHGSALAQAYNHMILPLANARDKYTQVLWGIADFEHRFQRRPEGMWLPETAVDLETLDVLAEHGIHFTILAPHQARRIKSIDGGEWLDVGGGKIDPSRPYLARLPSGRTIALFFYDGAISHAVAFEGLLSNGERFAHRLLEAVAQDRSGPQLVHIATDGESYGHHHRGGNRALAFALHTIETRKLARITVTANIWNSTPRSGRWKSSNGARGVVPTASSAGGPTAAAMPADIPGGIRAGGRPCGRPSIGSGIPWPRPTSRKCRNWASTRGRPATTMSGSSWTGPRPQWIPF